MSMQVIRGALLLDVGAKRVDPADIFIDGDSILETGPHGMAVPEGTPEFDARDRLVIPGLVNAHTHGHGSFGKGLGDKWSLELLLNAAPWTSGGFTLEDKRLAAQLNAAEMVLKGCTSAYDMYFEFPTTSVESVTAIVDGYRDLGVRVSLAPMMADITLFRAIPGLMDALPPELRARAEAMKTAPHEAHIAACREILETWRFDPAQAWPALGPTIPLHCTDAFLSECRDLAAEYDVGIQMHLAESKVQAVAAQERYGMSLATHLEKLGVLSQRFTGAHCIWLEPDDIRRLAAHGASVAHNPGSNLRLGSGIAPARAFLDQGLTVGIGSDGSVSSDNQNMFEAMRMAAFVSRTKYADPEQWLGTWDVLEMATTGGAKLMGLGAITGRIAPGFRADLVFLDLTNVNFVPLNDAANQIVNCEDSSAVDSVMIDGRMVLEHRQFTSFDFDRLRGKVAESVDRLSRANQETRAVSDAMARYVSSHCVGLACSH
jgi:guanine deaminase